MLHAVLVGIDQYRDPDIRGLRCARRDAETMATLLSERILPEERDVRLLVDEHATRENVLRVLGEELPRAVEREDIVLLYFACHGSPEKENPPDEISQYLILHDTSYARIFSTGLDMEQDIARLMRRLHKPELVVLFLDSCFSGRAGGRTFEGPRFKDQANGQSSPVNFIEDGPVSIKNLELGRGRVIIAAADDHQVAQENDALGHGYFTYFLLQALQDNASGLAVLSLGNLYSYLCSKVMEATKGKQEPVFNGRDVGACVPLLGKIKYPM